MKTLQLSIFLLFFLCGSVVAQKSSYSEMKLTFNAIGPIKIGMSIKEASAAFGKTLEYKETIEGCGWIGTPSLPKGIELKVVGGKVVMINVRNKDVMTGEGAHVGLTEKEIKDLFPGQVKVTNHEYLDGHYLQVKPKNSKYGYVFETEQSKVMSIRAGQIEDIFFVEGCL